MSIVMQRLVQLGAMFFLVACTNAPNDPTGVYLLDKRGKHYTLTLFSNGVYTLEFGGRDAGRTEIRGGWEAEHDALNRVSFDGIFWRGWVPQARPGYWVTEIEGFFSDRICVDPDSIYCFEKKE